MKKNSVWALVSIGSFWVDAESAYGDARGAPQARIAAAKVEEVLRTVCTSVSSADAHSWLVQTMGVEALESIHSLIRCGIAHVPGDNRTKAVASTIRSAYILTQHRPVESEMARLRATLRFAARDGGPPVDAGDDYVAKDLCAERDRSIEVVLRKALRDGGFYLEVQPVIDLHTGKLAYSEGLLRVAGTPFGPEDFIPVAERTGLIHIIGEHVLSLASSIVSDAAAQGLVARLAVNISPLQLRSSTLPRVLNTICTSVCEPTCFVLPESAPPGSKRLELEVTESIALTDLDFKAIRAFERQGYVVAVDDFGSGHSSIRQLLALAPSKIKIDREILALLTHSNQLGQLKNLTALAKARGSRVVVEGIETADQLKASHDAGAEFGQGFYLYRPMSPTAFIALLRSNNAANDCSCLVA